MVLLSASLLIFAAKPANAEPILAPYFSTPSQMQDGRRYDAVVGHDNTVGPIFMIWDTQTGKYKVLRTNSTAQSGNF